VKLKAPFAIILNNFFNTAHTAPLLETHNHLCAMHNDYTLILV
jgi:hypothetical protein